MNILKALIIGPLCGLFFCLPAQAQKTKAQLNTEITTTFPDNTVGQITPTGLRLVASDIANSIMPTAPVVAGNLACFSGTTGLLQDCGSAPATVPLAIGVTPIGNGTTTRVIYDNAGVLGEYLISGTGNVCMTTSCVMTTPNLGTPSAATLTNAIGLPVSTGISGLGTGIATSLAVNVGTAGAPVVNGGALGTPSSGTGTNLTGVPISTGLSGAGTGVLAALGNNLNASGGVVGFSGALGTPSSGTLTNATGLPVPGLAAGTIDTAIGYWGSTAASALAINNCSNALTYSTSTHTFGCNATAGTGTVTASGTPTAGQFAQWTSATNIQGISPAPITNSLGSNVAITTGGGFIDGPSVAQGTSGTWWASGGVSLVDTAGNNVAKCKLWDGTTVIDSRPQGLFNANVVYNVFLAGALASPAANIKISCSTTAAGATTTFRFNDSGASKDSTVSAHRIQ